METPDEYLPSIGRDVACAGRFSDHDWRSLAAQFGFAERELAIVKLVFDDKCDAEIASELAMSRHTVHTHFCRLYKKIGVHSRTQLVIDVFWHYLRMHLRPTQSKEQINDPQRAPGHEIFISSTWAAIGRSLALSPRELGIVKSIFDDDNEQTIADTLSISAHTVHTHLWRLYQKLGLHSRVGLVVRVFDAHLALHPGSDLRE